MKQLIKEYKKWVVKATKAAAIAKSKGQAKETLPEYIAADNMARSIWAKIKPLAVLFIALFLFASCNKIQTGHVCPFDHCPYKGIEIKASVYMPAITNETGCEEGTDCHIIDCLHFLVPDADYDTLEQMMWED